MERVTAAIMAAGTKYNAADVFQAYARLSQLQAQARRELDKVKCPHSDCTSTLLSHFQIFGV